MWTPDAIAKLQHSTRSSNFQTYKEYAQIINDQTRRHMTLRGLFEFRFDPAKAIPLEEVEPAAEIVKRFSSGAMSLGLDLDRGAHHAGGRDEPDRRQVEHRRRRRTSAPTWRTGRRRTLTRGDRPAGHRPRLHRPRPLHGGGAGGPAAVRRRAAAPAAWRPEPWTGPARRPGHPDLAVRARAGEPVRRADRQVLLQRDPGGHHPAAGPGRHRLRARAGGHRAGGVPGGDEDLLRHRRRQRGVRLPGPRLLDPGAAGGGAAAPAAGRVAVR